MSFKLISFTGSCGLASNIALAWAKAPYEVELIAKAELASPRIRALNPNGMVPILVHDDFVLYENAAVLGYVADKFPEAGLDGDGTPRGRAEVTRWLSVINSDVHPAFKPFFGATAYLEDAGAIEASKANARKVLGAYFARLDAQLEGRDWLTGARSIADAYLFVTLRWTHAVGVDVSGLANLRRFEAHMHADAGVQRALQEQRLG